MIVEFDIGNSRVKWRGLCQDGASPVGFFSHKQIEKTDDKFLAELEGAERIRVSSVADSLVPALHQLASDLNVAIDFAKTERACAGVINSYSNPSAMGVDRWLAMLAAFNESDDRQPCVVIDGGTSLTIDFLAASGQHLGGLILPGKRLLLDSLARNTEKVLFDPNLNDGELTLGCSTQAAVLNGCVHMMVGAIHQAIDSAGLLSDDCRYYLSGGDADMLQQHLQLEAKVVPDLVLDGLRYSLP